MLRVTDANTRPGHAGQSYTTPSAAHQNAAEISTLIVLAAGRATSAFRSTRRPLRRSIAA